LLKRSSERLKLSKKYFILYLQPCSLTTIVQGFFYALILLNRNFKVLNPCNDGKLLKMNVHAITMLEPFGLEIKKGKYQLVIKREQ
jgi:hypothetical protein